MNYDARAAYRRLAIPQFLTTLSMTLLLATGCTGRSQPTSSANSAPNTSSIVNTSSNANISSTPSTSAALHSSSLPLAVSSQSSHMSAPASLPGSSSRASLASSRNSLSSQSQTSTSSQTQSSQTQSSRSATPPPFDGTVYIDPDIFTANDPTSYQSMTYVGRGDREVYDSRANPQTSTQNVFRFTVTFDDGITTEIQAVPDFQTEQTAETQARLFAQALGRLPRQLREGVKIITLMQGDGRANASLEKGTIRIYNEGISADLREELLAHEAAHVALDPVFRSDSEWLHAQKTDRNFISTYARDNFGSEDIAESVLPYLAVRYKSDRISAANDRTISFNIAHRIAFFDRILTKLHPMIDISQQIKAPLQLPDPRKTLASDQVVFQWLAPMDSSQFDLVLGTSDYGANDLRSSNILVGSTELAVVVPQDGTPVYARLWTQKNNEWRFRDYRFAGFSPNLATASIRIPAPTSQLPSSVVTFHWDAPTGATEFDMIIGDQGAGSNNLRASAPFTGNQLRVSNLPEHGKPIYVRLWTRKNGWNYQDMEYLASQTRAELLTPTPGSQITGSNLTLTWSKPEGATAYDVILGTTGPGSNNLRATAILNGNSLTVTNLPTNGQKIYLRLWTYKNQWRYTDYTFND